VCREHSLGFHMDGARFAGAVVAAGCSPADLTWRAGVDALSFGMVKNGGMNAEALVFFNTDLADVTLYRRKQAGHLFSKGRFSAAQLLAMLTDDLWMHNARTANDAAQVIAFSAGKRLLYPVQANEIFLRLDPAEAESLRAAGFDFYDWGDGAARLVTSWQHSASDVQPLADAIAAL
jgi:threonine aldolase